DGIRSLDQLGEGAIDSADNSASGFSEQMSGMRTRVGEAFTNLSEAYTQQLSGLETSAQRAFDCAVAQLRETGNRSVQDIREGAESVKTSLNNSFGEEIGHVDAKIQDAACKAANKEQPAWKEVVAVILIILIIIIAIVVFGPLAAAIGGALGST